MNLLLAKSHTNICIYCVAANPRDTQEICFLHISAGLPALYHHATCFVDTVCLEKSTLANCLGISYSETVSLQWLFIRRVNNPKLLTKAVELASLQWSFFIFNASVISGALILQALFSFLLASRPICVCVCQ